MRRATRYTFKVGQQHGVLSRSVGISLGELPDSAVCGRHFEMVRLKLLSWRN